MNLNYYDILSDGNVQKVEKDIIWWAKNNPNGIMLINEDTLREFRKKLVEQYMKPQKKALELQMKEISICWFNIGGEKAILGCIYENESGNILYKQPNSWKEASIWYHFT